MARFQIHVGQKSIYMFSLLLSHCYWWREGESWLLFLFFSFLFHLVVTHYYLHPIDRAAATALVNRHADGSLPVEDFNLELEDQNGEKVRFGSETDRRYDTWVYFSCYTVSDCIFRWEIFLGIKSPCLLKVRFELSFERAMMMGLMLHANAKSLIKRHMYKDALEVLTMGEVSLSTFFKKKKRIEKLKCLPHLSKLHYGFYAIWFCN